MLARWHALSACNAALCAWPLLTQLHSDADTACVSPSQAALDTPHESSRIYCAQGAVAKASEGGSLVTLRPARRGRGRDSGWESDQDSGMAAALAASLREAEPMVRTKLYYNPAWGEL